MRKPTGNCCYRLFWLLLIALLPAIGKAQTLQSKYGAPSLTIGDFDPMVTGATLVIVTSNQETAMPDAPPVYGIKGFSLQSTSSKDTSISGTLTIVYDNGLYTPHDVQINLYLDNNQDGLLDAGDTHLGMQLFPVADLAEQTFQFNINSAYDGSLCPAIIASADFGDYALNYSYRCNTAQPYQSQMSSPTQVSQCQNFYFKVTGVEDFGKWVVDSGTAIITTPNIHNTAVTVPYGHAARLLWIAYAPPTAGSTIVYADTVFLYSDAQPVIDKLDDVSVCLGQPAGFLPEAHLDYADPRFQWYKEDVLIPGADSLNYVVSSNTILADAGVYTLRVFGNRGCDTTETTTLTVQAFDLNLQSDKDPVLSGDPITFSTSADFNYQVLAWKPEALFNNAMAKSQTVTLTDSSRTIWVIAESELGCVDTASLHITVEPNTEDLFFPNAFTPNNDGKNDLLKVYGLSIKQIELRIYNQWGQLLYETRDPQQGWDGRFRGKPQPVGPYIYTARVVLYNGQVVTKKASFTLIR